MRPRIACVIRRNPPRVPRRWRTPSTPPTATGSSRASSPVARGTPRPSTPGRPQPSSARALERHHSPLDEPEAGWQIGRITYEILRAVPIAPLRVARRGRAPGPQRRAAQRLARRRARARSSGPRPGGSPAARSSCPPASRATDAGSPARRPDPLPGPMEGSEEAFFATGHDVGYHTGMEYRFVAGRFLDPGPATVWMRMRQPLVAGEQPSPLQRVLVAADSGNGVSAALDWSRYLFINVDLSVHLHRMPASEWVCARRDHDPGADRRRPRRHRAPRRARTDRAGTADPARARALSGRLPVPSGALPTRPPLVSWADGGVDPDRPRR